MFLNAEFNLEKRPIYLIVTTMNIVKTSFSIPAIQLPSSYSIFKRIANLVLAVLAIIICINLWLIDSEQAENWHNNQTNQLGRTLSLLATKVLTQPLITNDSQAMRQQLAFLAADPHVTGVALYNLKGQLIDKRKNGASVLASYRLDKQIPLVFVEAVKYEGQILGYFRLMLSEQKVMQYHEQYQRQFFQQLQVLMLLAAAGGLLLTRAWYKFRYRHLIKTAQSEQS
jgi:membrane protein